MGAPGRGTEQKQQPSGLWICDRSYRSRMPGGSVRTRSKLASYRGEAVYGRAGAGIKNNPGTFRRRDDINVIELGQQTFVRRQPKSCWTPKRTPKQSHSKRLRAPCGQPPLCDCLPALFCKEVILMVWGPLQKILFAGCFCSTSLPSLFGPYFIGGLAPDKIRRVKKESSFFLFFRGGE